MYTVAVSQRFGRPCPLEWRPLIFSRSIDRSERARIGIVGFRLFWPSKMIYNQRRGGCGESTPDATPATVWLDFSGQMWKRCMFGMHCKQNIMHWPWGSKFQCSDIPYDAWWFNIFVALSPSWFLVYVSLLERGTKTAKIRQVLWVCHPYSRSAKGIFLLRCLQSHRHHERICTHGCCMMLCTSGCGW